jgi:hypothetical protein
VAPPSSQHVPDAVADHCDSNLGVEPFGRGNEQIWVWFGIHNLWHALPVVGRACHAFNFDNSARFWAPAFRQSPQAANDVGRGKEQRVQRIVLAALRPKSVREPEEILLKDRAQHRGRAL